MNKFILVQLMLPLLLLLGRAAPGADEKPNIIILNVDDLGAMDVGFTGGKRYATPHIDRLAAEGMVFTQGYAPAANCAPSRACMLTGQYGPRHGVYTVGSSERGEAHLRKLIPTPNTRHVAESNVLLPAALQTGGYVTGNIGKWHISEDPATRGFNVNIAGSKIGRPTSYFSPYKIPGLPEGPPGEYLTDRLATEAIRFIEIHQGRPFFLLLSFYAVHTPLQPRPDLLARQKKRPGVSRKYAAMVAAVDENIGRILKTVDALDLAKKTIVIFTSDNGAMSRASSQAPLRAGKGTSYEGGVRVPLAVRWPARVKAASRCDEPASGLDFYPTLLAAAGIAPPEAKILDGANLLPLWTQRGEGPDRALYWHFPIYLQTGRDHGGRDPHFRTRPGCAMRYGRWKLHEFFEDGALELYDLEKDPGEQQDLAAEAPEKLAELHKMMLAWRKAAHAPVPTELNPAYRPDAGKK